VRYHLILLFKLQPAARVYVLIFQQLGVSLNVVFFYRNLSTQPGFVFVDKENCHQEDNKKGPLRMLSFHSRMLLKRMMMAVGSDGMIVSFLCLVLRSRQTVMFAIWSLVQEKYPMCMKILGHLRRELGEKMQIMLVSYPYSLVFALVCSLIFYNI
jgi:hypothetical protein